MFKYAEKVDDDFLCSICKDVLDDAMTTPCRHTFCKTCIEEWIKEAYSCPLDKSRLISSDLVPIPIAFTNLLDRLNVCCKFEEEGCDYKCPRSDLEGHIKRCPFNPTAEFECDKGCGLMLTSSQLGDHRCIYALKKIVLDLKLENENLTNDLVQQKALESVLKKNCCTAQERIEALKTAHVIEINKIREEHAMAIEVVKIDLQTAKVQLRELHQNMEVLRRKQAKSVKSRLGSSIRGLYPKKSHDRILVTNGINWGVILRFAGKASIPRTAETPELPSI